MGLTLHKMFSIEIVSRNISGDQTLSLWMMMVVEKSMDESVVKVAPKKRLISWPAVYQYLLDYCNDTTIHGFKVSIKINTRYTRPIDFYHFPPFHTFFSCLLCCAALKYIGETSRPWIERIFWMIAFIISTIGCALLIAEMFEKLQTNPITVSLAERPSSIQEVNEPHKN